MVFDIKYNLYLPEGGVFKWHTISEMNVSVAVLVLLTVLHLASLRMEAFSKSMRQTASSVALAQATVL